MMILIAEDDEDIAGILEFVAREAGYRTMVAHNGVEALALARDRHPAAVLLDIHMPLLEGPDFLHLERLFAGDQTPVVIVITADDRPRQTLGDLRYDAILRKPFEIADVQALLHRFVPLGPHAKE